MKGIRDNIREVLSADPRARRCGLTLAQVVRRTNLDAKKVSSHLSALVLRTQEAEVLKYDGSSYGYYRLKKPGTKGGIGIQDRSLKLAQLRSLKPQLVKVGLTLVNEIIKDYENTKG